MKHLFVIGLICCSISLIAQESGENYYFKTTLGKTSSSELLKNGDNENLNIEEGIYIRKRAKIKVLRIEDDRIIFKYINYPSNKELQEKYNGGENGEKEFSLQKEVFNGLTSPFYQGFRGFSLGSYAIPIRLRSSKGVFEFESNLNLGLNLIGRVGIDRYKEDFFFDISAGIGITRVNLNESNSRLGEGDFADISVQNPAALTFTLGILVNLSQKVNVGGYLGWDSLATIDNAPGWIYNKKPWIGIGLGISVGDPSNSSANQLSNDEK